MSYIYNSILKPETEQEFSCRNGVEKWLNKVTKKKDHGVQGLRFPRKKRSGVKSFRNQKLVRSNVSQTSKTQEYERDSGEDHREKQGCHGLKGEKSRGQFIFT